MMILKDKLLYTIQELAEINGGPIPMSVSGIYKACRDGAIETTVIGRRVFVPKVVVEKLLNGDNR